MKQPHMLDISDQVDMIKRLANNISAITDPKSPKNKKALVAILIRETIEELELESYFDVIVNSPCGLIDLHIKDRGILACRLKLDDFTDTKDRTLIKRLAVTEILASIIILNSRV